MHNLPVAFDWIDYLQTQPWTQFATFTTARPITLKSARRLMDKVGNRVLREGEKLFWAAERFELGREGYHTHALINTRQSPKQVEDWFSKKYGRADVTRYDPNRGAAGYVAKYMLKGCIDYDMLVGRGETELFGINGKQQKKKQQQQSLKGHR
jgi:hypothetical protein